MRSCRRISCQHASRLTRGSARRSTEGWRGPFPGSRAPRKGRRLFTKTAQLRLNGSTPGVVSEAASGKAVTLRSSSQGLLKTCFVGTATPPAISKQLMDFYRSTGCGHHIPPEIGVQTSRARKQSVKKAVPSPLSIAGDAAGRSSSRSPLFLQEPLSVTGGVLVAFRRLLSSQSAPPLFCCSRGSTEVIPALSVVIFIPLRGGIEAACRATRGDESICLGPRLIHLPSGSADKPKSTRSLLRAEYSPDRIRKSE